ncbi:hypothetical protein SKAU_G00023790 [Synaphobranchus kaupii]|uniref:Uncharacterized protein n=1 Tax=Synaphobranchus kaupii TaxID=118154 RepID=A0A9Q1GCA7_SYNKA|nr:hypothetical protein SKAU_G00023790 [Synaphobranchus kaupii]
MQHREHFRPARRHYCQRLPFERDRNPSHSSRAAEKHLLRHFRQPADCSLRGSLRVRGSLSVWFGTGVSAQFGFPSCPARPAPEAAPPAPGRSLRLADTVPATTRRGRHKLRAANICPWGGSLPPLGLALVCSTGGDVTLTPVNACSAPSSYPKSTMVLIRLQLSTYVAAQYQVSLRWFWAWQPVHNHHGAILGYEYKMCQCATGPYGQLLSLLSISIGQLGGRAKMGQLLGD